MEGMSQCFWVFLGSVNCSSSLLEGNSQKLWTLSVANTKAPFFSLWNETETNSIHVRKQRL